MINLINTLDFLDEDEKPEVFLFYRSDLKKYLDNISYPYLASVGWSFPAIYKGYLKSLITGENMFISGMIRQYDLDALFPVHDLPIRTKTRTKLISWYADLQHKYYPEFFTRKKILERNLRIKFMLRNSDALVVSSHAVKSDFERFFRLPDSLRINVFHFVSVIEDFNNTSISGLLKKYQLPEKYFIISNQFHKHKNHKIVLESLIRLKGEISDIHIVMTGRLPDASYSPYLRELHSLISKNGLHSQISFLGVIPRNEQLMLIKHSQAVLQPSLFEGWSTVIEDARSLQVPVIASKIAVHIEQLGLHSTLFNPHDPGELAVILNNFPERNVNAIIYDDYNYRIKQAAGEFLKVCS